MSSKPTIIHHLEMVASTLPAPIYWLDTNSRLLGANEVFLKAIGASGSLEQWLGKNAYDVYPFDLADMIVKHNEKVMKTGITSEQEETIQDITKGVLRHFLAAISPLYDDNGTVIGVVGTSIEITAQKEAEQRESELLRQESERQQIVLQEKEKLITLAHKVAHDICSPLSALNMMINYCNELPENKRSVIKRATESIFDIANNLLSTYRSPEPQASSSIEARQPVLISDLINQLLSEKKAQYGNQAVKFVSDIADEAQFAFIDVQKSEFRRSMSNLINNAVDALENTNQGLVTVRLTATDDSVVAVIEDNGKGMTEQNIQKIQQRQEFTEGKAQGHGLGLQQVWDMLEYNHARLNVQSTPGKGTKIQLTFPKIPAVNWIAQQINFASNQIIIILDDEESVHGAWDMRFTPLLSTYPELTLYHFTQGQEVLDFINNLDQLKKHRVTLLSDYELLHQSKNGLEIIQATHTKQAILVTSHYTNSTILDEAIKLGIKVLPKQLTSIIPVKIDLAIADTPNRWQRLFRLK